MVGPTRVDGLVEVQARSLRVKVTATNPRADGAPEDELVISPSFFFTSPLPGKFPGTQLCQQVFKQAAQRGRQQGWMLKPRREVVFVQHVLV